jgi:hypothetical protein
VRRLAADPHLLVALFERDDGVFVCRVIGRASGGEAVRFEIPIDRDLGDVRSDVADVTARAMDALVATIRARSPAGLAFAEDLPPTHLTGGPTLMSSGMTTMAIPSSQPIGTILIGDSTRQSK